MELKSDDVVRHRLVKDIVDAYVRADEVKKAVEQTREVAFANRQS